MIRSRMNRSGWVPGWADCLRGSAHVDSMPAIALIGVVMALVCPYLARGGHETIAWVVGVALGIVAVALAVGPWCQRWLAERRANRRSDPPPAKPPGV